MYVCNTEAGAVLELRLPGLQTVQALRLFSLKEHLNSVAPLEPGVLWGILHNLGAVPCCPEGHEGHGSKAVRVGL